MPRIVHCGKLNILVGLGIPRPTLQFANEGPVAPFFSRQANGLRGVEFAEKM